jgi:hypothetical protein
MAPLCLEHEAGPAEALETAAHLAACGACAASAEADRRLNAALRGLVDPAPRRDVAAPVLAALRRARPALPRGRALKWSAIGLAAVALTLDGTGPSPRTAAGLRMLARLGELVDLDGLLDRIGDGLAKIVPAPSRALEIASGAAAAIDGGAALPATARAAAVVVAVVLLGAASACALVAGGLALRAGSRALARRHPRVF